MNEDYWSKFYEKAPHLEESSFARSVLPYIYDKIVDLGCGDGRDSEFFKNHKFNVTSVDDSSDYGIRQNVADYIKSEASPKSVYTRFFWHSIERELQLAILDWTKEWLFIEARTTDDSALFKEYSDHQRNYVDVAQLVSDLKTREFQLVHLFEGQGLATFKDEDPHVVRIIARKNGH